MSFLKKLQNEPEGKRRRFALIWASILTLVIFVVWFSVFQISFGVGKKKKVDNSPLQSLNSVFGSFGEDIRAVFGEVKDKIGSTTGQIFEKGDSGSASTEDSGGNADRNQISQPLPFQ